MNYDEVLCRRIQEVKPSGIQRFFDVLEETKDTISLGVGEPDFVTPWHIRDTDIYSLEKGFTKYTSNAGMAKLRREVVAYLNHRFGLQYDFAHQIVVTMDGSEAIDLALRYILNPGDEVIIPVPPSVRYGPLTSMAGGTPVCVELKAENELCLTAAQLRATLTPRTKAVALPLPSNPAGSTLERADLGTLAEVLKDTNATVLSGKIHVELTYGQKHAPPANLPELYDHTVVVNGFFKSHAVTGWHVDYVCGLAPALQQMLKLHQFDIMSAPTTGQCAAIEAMCSGNVDIGKIRGEYDGRRRYLVEGLRRIGSPCFEPKDAFYVFPDIRGTGLTSDKPCEWFSIEEKVAVISDAALGPGGESFTRCCYATNMKNITETLTRMDSSLTNLRRK